MDHMVYYCRKCSEVICYSYDLKAGEHVACSNGHGYVYQGNHIFDLLEDCISPDFTIDLSQQKHYTQWKMQPITFIVANDLDFCQGNVIKYVMRYKEKNGLEDLKKAKVYIDYLIQKLEKGEVKP